MKNFFSVSRRSCFGLVALGLVLLFGSLAGCSSNDYYGNSNVNGSFTYGVGVYDSWGYYGNPYYGHGHGGGGVVIVTPPHHSQRPGAQPRRR